MNMCRCAICESHSARSARPGDVIVPKKNKLIKGKKNEKIVFNLKDITSDRFFTYDMDPIFKKYGRESILAFATLERANRKIAANNKLSKLEKEGRFVVPNKYYN